MYEEIYLALVTRVLIKYFLIARTFTENFLRKAIHFN